LSFDSGTGACTEIYASSNNLIISTPLNGNVGINNSSPVHRLSVNGTTFLGGAVSGITTLAAGNTTITGFMNVSSNLMIGSAPTLGPFAPTTIVSGTTVGQNYQISLSPVDGALGRESGIRFGATFSQGWGGTDFVSRYSGAISYGAAGGGATPRLHAMKFYTGDASDVPTERMRIDNTGNVAIGNTSPAHKLRVEGTTSLAGAVSDITTLAAGNTTITGFINATSTISTSAGANGVQLTNATSNWIGWNTNGVGAPTTTTASAGTKLMLYPSVSASSVDYAIGVEGNHLWFSTWSSATGGFKWYANTNNFMTANVTGLYHSGLVNAASYNIGATVVANASHLYNQLATSYYRSGSTDVALADGGTNSSLTAAAGAIAFSNATGIALTAVGTSGQVLTSAAAGTPTWTSQSSLSVGNATLLNNKTEGNLNVNNATYVGSKDGDRNPNTKLPTTTPYSVRFDFVGAANANTGGNYAGVMTYAPWDGTTASTGDASYQLAFGSTAASGAGLPQLNIRKGIDSTWNTWYTLLHSGNYNNYSPTLTGTGASGTWGITITGNVQGFANNVQGGGPNRIPYNTATSTTAFLPAGAAGEVLVSGGTGAAPSWTSAVNAAPFRMTNATANVFFAAANGNIGINDITPAYKLTVAGTISYTSRPGTGAGVTLVVNTATGVIRETTSSIRFKHDVKEYTKGLNEVKQLEPVTFKYTNDDSAPVDRLGFIAESVDEIGLSEVVLYDTDNLPYSLEYGSMVALLTNAIKEQQAMIESLTARVAALESGS
jgi:hypothetical protein